MCANMADWQVTGDSAQALLPVAPPPRALVGKAQVCPGDLTTYPLRGQERAGQRLAQAALRQPVSMVTDVLCFIKLLTR